MSHIPMDPARERWLKLGRVLKGKHRICILTHDNPDPDALAGALALKTLVEEVSGAKAVIAHGGALWRLENRNMVRILKIEAIPAADIDPSAYDAMALVDTQPGAGNNSLPPRVTPNIVIDHHFPLRRKTSKAAFHDVRPDYGSVSTILAEYFKAGGLKFSSRIATALLFGIKTDTQELSRHVHPADAQAYRDVLDFVNLKALARLEERELVPEYFLWTQQAIKAARLYGSAVLVAPLSNPAVTPDFLAAAADIFIRMKGVHVAAVCAAHENAVYVSLRCRKGRLDAARLLRTAVGRRGMAGGHQHMAGGKIPIPAENPDRAPKAMNSFIQRLLGRLKHDPVACRTLVSEGERAEASPAEPGPPTFHDDGTRRPGY